MGATVFSNSKAGLYSAQLLKIRVFCVFFFYSLAFISNSPLFGTENISFVLVEILLLICSYLPCQRHYVQIINVGIEDPVLTPLFHQLC